MAESTTKAEHVIGVDLGGTKILAGVFNHSHECIRRAQLSTQSHPGGDKVSGPKCGCGNKGCFEALASRSAIFQQIKAGVKDGQKTLLTEMLGDDLEDLRSGDLRKAIRRGDKFVDRIVESAAEYIGIATSNLVNILGPEVVVLGGGVIEALADEMMSVIIETTKDYAMPGTLKGVEIIASKLGDNAGITGAAVLARKETK